MGCRSNSSDSAACNVVAVRYPGRGHINPMFTLCKILASKRSRLLITFVVTEEWLSLVDRGTHIPDNLVFATVPNVTPSESNRGKDFQGFCEAVSTKMQDPFEWHLDGCPTTSLILVDTVLYWVVDVGRAKNVPVASFWPQASSELLRHLSHLGTISMVAAICYAWLLENRLRPKKGENNGQGPIVVPVMNVKRVRMWKLCLAAWLFHHVGLDVMSLFFADEVDLESLMMAGKLSIHVVGQDVLKSNGEVKSQCTILTDNYCEEAYDLLQNSMLKKLLVAGVLFDTQNLSTTPKLFTIRDAEAVKLLLVNVAPNYRNTLSDQLTKDHRDNVLWKLYSLFMERYQMMVSMIVKSRRVE